MCNNPWWVPSSIFRSTFSIMCTLFMSIFGQTKGIPWSFCEKFIWILKIYALVCSAVWAVMVLMVLPEHFSWLISRRHLLLLSTALVYCSGMEGEWWPICYNCKPFKTSLSVFSSPSTILFFLFNTTAAVWRYLIISVQNTVAL